MNFDLPLWIDVATLVAVPLSALWLKSFLPSYMKRKGENQATKEDIAEITRQIEAVKLSYSGTLEQQKASLRAAELLFPKKLEALLELNKLIALISPPLRHPDMDWHEACDQIAQEFGRLEEELGSYLAKYDAVLSTSLADALSEARATCAQGKFDVEGDEVPKHANSDAEMVFDRMDQCSTELKTEIAQFVSVPPPAV